MILWVNKEEWGGHNCCVALRSEEVKCIVDALANCKGDEVEMISSSLSGMLNAVSGKGNEG